MWCLVSGWCHRCYFLEYDQVSRVVSEYNATNTFSWSDSSVPCGIRIHSKLLQKYGKPTIATDSELMCLIKPSNNQCGSPAKDVSLAPPHESWGVSTCPFAQWNVWCILSQTHLCLGERHQLLIRKKKRGIKIRAWARKNKFPGFYAIPIWNCFNFTWKKNMKTNSNQLHQIFQL